MEKRDFIILLLSLGGKHTMTSLQIMYSLFIFKVDANLSDDEFYSFRPYLYGPSSLEVYSDLNGLKNDAVVFDFPLSPVERGFSLTGKGRKMAEDISKGVNPSLMAKLAGAKNFVTSRRIMEVYSYLLSKFPEYFATAIAEPF